MAPRLTIITPSFNQADYIERTLESVLGQGYPDLEYFVVDGGSTDGSAEIIERYSDRLTWWVSEPDRGQTHALNKGLDRATGDIVAYINSDDYYLPGSFEAAAEALSRTDASWLAGRCRYVEGDTGAASVWIPQPPGRQRHWWMLEPWGVPQAATFWRRSVFERHGPFREDMHYVFDTELGLRLAYKGEPPAIIDRELAVRYLHDEAKSADLDPFFEEMKRFVELFSPDLDERELRDLRRTQALRGVGWYGARRCLARLKRRVTGEPEPPIAVVELHE